MVLVNDQADHPERGKAGHRIIVETPVYRKRQTHTTVDIVKIDNTISPKKKKGYCYQYRYHYYYWFILIGPRTRQTIIILNRHQSSPILSYLMNYFEETVAGVSCVGVWVIRKNAHQERHWIRVK